MKQSKFQFLNPYLKETYFIINPEFPLDSVDNEIEMENAFNVHIKRYKNENKANVELTLETNMENEEAPFKLQIKVASDFKWEDLNEEMIENMLKINAPTILLGYMRPIVANLTNFAGLPAYNLPFIDFVN